MYRLYVLQKHGDLVKDQFDVTVGYFKNKPDDYEELTRYLFPVVYSYSVLEDVNRVSNELCQGKTMSSKVYTRHKDFTYNVGFEKLEIRSFRKVRKLSDETIKKVSSINII